MKINARKIIEEALPEDFRVWATQALVRPLNSFMTDVVKLANNGITFGDNVAAQIILNQTISIPDDWIYVGAGGPAFQNQWGNADAIRRVSFRITPYGTVKLRGVAAGGNALGVLFALPAGYQPAFAQSFNADSGGGYGVVTVGANGDVTQTSGVSAWQFLDGIAFDSATRLPVPSAVWPVLYKCTLAAAPAGVWLGNVVDQSASRALNPIVGVDWEWVTTSDGNFIKVKNIPGLLPNRKYQFTLFAVTS